jgi:uncharacterized membrane protein YgcG
MWGSIPPQPGTINYIEGQAAIGTQTLNGNAAGSAKLEPGQTLATQNGRAEILLTPGIFLRLDSHSAAQMVSPDLTNTEVTLQKGRAMVEVDYIRPENNIRITENGTPVQLRKKGLYDIDVDHNVIRVFDGEAEVLAGNQRIEVKKDHELNLAAGAPLKTHKFDKKEFADDFYNWGSLRSSYLADANVTAARGYAGGTGWAPTMWYGTGWYWNPWFTAYTFIPGDGFFYDPFGWGFYSPFYAPYIYGGFYGGGFYRHFGPGYVPPRYLTTIRATGGYTGAFHNGTSVTGFSRGGFSAGGGFRGTPGGFGGGFHGGGGRR